MPRSRDSGGQPLTQEILALLGALAALTLRTTEELRQLLVAVALGVLRVLLHPEHVAKALLGEPEQVVVLVLGAGDVAGLLLLAHHISLQAALRRPVAI